MRRGRLQIASVGREADDGKRSEMHLLHERSGTFCSRAGGIYITYKMGRSLRRGRLSVALHRRVADLCFSAFRVRSTGKFLVNGLTGKLPVKVQA